MAAVLAAPMALFAKVRKPKKIQVRYAILTVEVSELHLKDHQIDPIANVAATYSAYNHVVSGKPINFLTKEFAADEQPPAFIGIPAKTWKAQNACVREDLWQQYVAAARKRAEALGELRESLRDEYSRIA